MIVDELGAAAMQGAPAVPDRIERNRKIQSIYKLGMFGLAGAAVFGIVKKEPALYLGAPAVAAAITYALLPHT